MKIFFDHQAFTFQDFGGISKYYSELIPTLNMMNVKTSLPLLLSNNENLAFINNFGKNTFFKNHKFKGKHRFLNAINTLNTSLKLTNDNYDIFHPTYYKYPNIYNFAIKKNAKIAVTVYDMNHELYPELFMKNDSTILQKKILIKKADVILAISESTKNDIIKLLGISETKIFITPLNAEVYKKSEFILNLPTKYILFVGHREGYKNFNLFVKSIFPLFAKDNELKLVCLGANGFSESEKDFFASKNIQDKILYFKYNENELYTFYNKALLFVFPSLYEGFGLPILEAFSSECPCALSNTSSLPEVGGDAALYFDPKSQSSILNAIEKIIYSKEIRNTLINKGIERKKIFSWESCAEKTLNGYKSLF